MEDISISSVIRAGGEMMDSGSWFLGWWLESIMEQPAVVHEKKKKKGR